MILKLIIFICNLMYILFYVIDDPEKKSKFLRKHLESESEIRNMLKAPKSKTAAELVSKIHEFSIHFYNFQKKNKSSVKARCDMCPKFRLY